MRSFHWLTRNLIKESAEKSPFQSFDRMLYWTYPQNHSLGHRASVGLRQGDHKLIHWLVSGKSAVYNVEQDISELNDLSRSNPELTARLMNRLISREPMKPILKKAETE